MAAAADLGGHDCFFGAAPPNPTLKDMFSKVIDVKKRVFFRLPVAGISIKKQRIIFGDLTMAFTHQLGKLARSHQAPPLTTVRQVQVAQYFS